MKRKQKMWGFAALVAIVVGYALYDYKSLESAEKAKEEQSLLLPFPAAQIAELAISNSQGEIHLKKDKDGWKMLKPVEDLADSPVADQFVEGLATEKSTDVAVEGGTIDLSAFGLDTPKGTVSVASNSGEKLQLAVGSRKNFQGDAFLRKNQENKVLIASSTWFAKLDKPALEFRDKRLMRVSNAQVEKITFEKGKDKFELAKKELEWVLPAHPDWKLDQNKVRELLTMLNVTQAIEFIAEKNAKPEELKKWGLLNPRLNLTVGLKDQKTWNAKFAAGSDKVHRVQVSEPEFVLKISPTDSDKFFQMTASYFRDLAEPFRFSREPVQTVEVKTTKLTKSFKKDEEKGSELLSQLGKLSIFDFAENRNAKLDQEITLLGDGGKEVFKLQWGNPHQIKVNGENVSVFDAKTSLYPKSFKLLENDISSLKLNDEIEVTGTEKEKEK